MKQIKKVALVFSLLLVSFKAFSEDDFESLFEAAEDVTIAESPAVTAVSSSGPLKFSGSFTSDLGAGLSWNSSNGNFSPLLYFDLENPISFTVRADRTLGVHGTYGMGFTGLDTHSPQFKFGLDSLYMDYLAFDRFFITAGKVTFNWGYPRISTDTTTLFKSTNINNNQSPYSVMVRLPFSNMNFSVLTTVNTSKVALGHEKKALAMAYSAECVFGNTSVNLFGKIGEGDITGKTERALHLGAEAKSSFGELDLYSQIVAGISHVKLSVNNILVTCGGYYYENFSSFDFGMNLELQDYIDLLSGTQRFVCELQSGLKNFDRTKTLSLGFDGQFNFTEKSIYTKTALIKSGLFPHAKWNNGVEVSWSQAAGLKLALGSTIAVSFDY